MAEDLPPLTPYEEELSEPSHTDILINSNEGTIQIQEKESTTNSNIETQNTNQKHDPEDTQDSNDDKDTEDEWISYSIKFDYYHDIEEEHKTNTEHQIDITDDEKDFVKTEGTAKILESLKIALTFLLHPQSPLFSTEMEDEDAQQRLRHFQDQCAIFNNNKYYHEIGNASYWKQRLEDLESFYSETYAENEHKILYELWSKWKGRTTEDTREEALFTVFINATETLHLDKFADVFMKSTEQMLFELESNTPKKDSIYTANVELNANYLELKGIKTVKAMNKWLHINQTLKANCNDDDTINTNSKPMVEWNWKELVSFIGEIDEIAHFCSVLYQYQINGKEICVMDLRQIQYLIECSMLNTNGITLNELNDIKLQCKQEKVEWSVIKDAKKIKRILDHMRVQSHIVSQYYFASKVLKSSQQIFDDIEQQKDAQKLLQLIHLLQVDPTRGPKYFWKMDMIYFSKIDNFLAVLTTNTELGNLFQRCFPDFLTDENNELTRFDIDNEHKYQSKSAQNRRSTPSLRRRLSADADQRDVFGDMKEDYVDKTVDLLCSCDYKCSRKCNEFVHDLHRLYIKTFSVLLISLLTGCICMSLWYSNSSLFQINEAMSLTLKILGDRTRNKMVYEYWKPQMFTNTAINALLDNILLDKRVSEPSYVNDTTYDYYLQQFSEHANTNNVWALWLYNNDTDILTGAYRLNDEDIIISIFDPDGCNYEWLYDNTTKQREDALYAYNSDCDYVPRGRPWFKLSETLHHSNASWTEPYSFVANAGGDSTVGVSLVTPIIDDNGTLLIFLCEMTTGAIAASLADTFTSLPVGTILMMATQSLDLMFASHDDAIDIPKLGIVSNNALISDALEYLREHNDTYLEDITFDEYNVEDGYYVSVYPFNMIYIDFFSDSPSELLLSDNYQNGYVIIANDATYRDAIEIAYNATFVILITMLIIAFLNVCLQIEYEKEKGKQSHRASRGQLIKINRRQNTLALQMLTHSSQQSLTLTGYNSRTSRSPGASPYASTIALQGMPTKQHFVIKHENGLVDVEKEIKEIKESLKLSKCHVCHCSHDSLLMFTLFQIIITLLSVSILWEYSDSSTKNVLLNDIIPKQEFNAVADEVHYMFEVSDMIEKTLQQNTERMMNENDDIAADRFLINLMKSYVRPNSEFTPFMIYYGTPQGRFLGTIRVPNTNDLQHLRRDESTGFDRVFYNVISGNLADYNDIIDRQDLYDPRCRPWYVVALDKSFSGSMDSAYPNGSFHSFLNDEYPPSFTQNCDDAKDAAMELYGVSSANKTANFSDFSDSLYINNDERTLVWARYVFAELTTIGLTASSTVTNAEGEVLAVIAIDWVLDSLSQLLVSAVEESSIDNNNNNNNSEYSWIFESNTDDAVMIASSDMITITDSSNVEGCLTFSGGTDAEQVPLVATDHPTYDIRVNSIEIIDIHGLDTLSINTAVSNSVSVPLGLQHLESGRISYYDIDSTNNTAVNTHVEHNVDWIICRTMDQSAMEIQDIRFTIMLTISIIFAVALLLKKFARNRINKKRKKGDKGGDEEEEDEDEDEDDEDDNDHHHDDLFKIMYKMKPIIMNSANCIWRKEQYLNDGDLMTTDMSKDFCANRANELIASTEDKYVFLKCIWTLDAVHGDHKILFHDVMHSNVYSTYIAFVIGLHLLCTLFDIRSRGVFYSISLCIFLEFVDFCLMFVCAYMEWNLDRNTLITLYEINWGGNHKFVSFLRKCKLPHKHRSLFLMFRGPNCHFLLIHLCVLLSIFIDFIISTANPSIFTYAYYIPILPSLLILRNRQIYNFGKDFVYALWKSKHVLLSYASFIFMISVLTISLFGFMSQENTKINSFYSIGEAIVTSFVYMSTAENYNIVYDIFSSSFYSSHPILLNYALWFLIIVGMLGTFFFIPVIIHQFEFAFNELELAHKKKFNFEKTNSIIAAFIMLDMNNDQGIDHEELKQLISKSILMDKNAVFDVFEDADDDAHDDDDDGDGIDLPGFVNYLIVQEFRNKIKNTTPLQSKVQALLECNVIRRPQYNNFILISLVIPTYIFSVLRGLNGFRDDAIEYILIILFAANFVEINMRWFSFGGARYFDVKSHRNPNYMIASINRYYQLSQTSVAANSASYNADSQSATRLSAAEIQWAMNNLHELRPLSIDEKSMLSLTHRIEFIVIYFSLCAFVICNFFDLSENESFAISFIQFGILLRTFTLLKSNQILTYSLFTVFPQFMSLIIFLFLYIYWWARLGLILFGNNITRFVIQEIYESAPNIVANFNSSAYGIITLIQLLFGEAWHEVMYLNALATSMICTAYFIIYIAVVTIIVSNIFVGLFLAGIDDLDKAHKAESDLKKLQKCLKSKKLFKKYAAKKLKSIEFQLKENEMKNKKLTKQKRHINKLLRHVNLKDF